MDDESDKVSSRGSFTDEYHEDSDCKGFSQANSNTSRILLLDIPPKKLDAIPETKSEDDSDKYGDANSGNKKGS
jgi:hypothetical protein